MILTVTSRPEVSGEYFMRLLGLSSLASLVCFVTSSSAASLEFSTKFLFCFEFFSSSIDFKNFGLTGFLTFS